MLSAEKKLQEYNPELYEAVIPYIDLVPDFRPEETKKRMKEEKQDNWGRLVNELEAIAYNEEHNAILSMINSGEKLQLEKWIDSKEIISDFLFSYPVLSWLMLQVSPRSTIVPLLISQGKYLKHIPLRKDDISYIRDIKTAKN